MKSDNAFERAMRTIARFGEESAGNLTVTAAAFAEAVRESVALFAGDDDYAVLQRNRDALSEVGPRDGSQGGAQDGARDDTRDGSQGGAKGRLHANPSIAAWNDALKRNRFMVTGDNDGYLVEKRYRSWMLIPVFSKKEIAIAVIVARKKGKFGEDETRAAERLGEWLTQTLRDQRRRNKRVASIAEDARHGMLLGTQETLSKGNLEAAGFAQTTDFGARTGSDFAKAWKTQDGGLLSVVCDVTAGDAERQSALVYLDAWFSILSRTALDARGMLERLNADMLKRGAECYAAIALIKLDRKNGKAEIAGCGNACVVFFDHGTMEARAFDFGPVAGISAEGEIRSHSTPVNSGDILLACTDGICGAKKRNGDLFGADGVLDVVRKNYFLSAADLAARVFSVLGEKEDAEVNADDRSLQAIKIE